MSWKEISWKKRRFPVFPEDLSIFDASRRCVPGMIIALLDPLARLLFVGLWTIADKEGRLEDRPTRIKYQIQPYDNTDTDKQLADIEALGFIVRYSINGKRYIQIRTFTEHQHPHVKESKSIIPALNEHDASMAQEPYKSDTSPVQAPCKSDTNPVQAPVIHPTCTPTSTSTSTSTYGIRNTEYEVRSTKRRKRRSDASLASCCKKDKTTASFRPNYRFSSQPLF
jgi:hypothetical protein